MVEVPGLGGVHPGRALLAVAATVVVVVVVASGESVPTLELVGYAIATVALVALAFDDVRERPGARFAQTAAIAVALVLVYVAPPRTLLEAGIAAVAVLAVIGDAVTQFAGSSSDR